MGIRLRDRAEVLVPVRSPDPANPKRRRPDWTVDPAQTIPVRFQADQTFPVTSSDPGAILTSWTGRLGPTARWTDDDGEHLVDMVATVTKACRIRWHGTTYAIEEIAPRRHGSAVRFLTVSLSKVTSS